MNEGNRAARLRIVRETLGLSQRDFAKDLGVAPSALAQWETERHALPGPIARLLTLYEEQLRLAPPPAEEKPRRARSTAWVSRTASTAYAGALWAILRKSEDRPGASAFERSVRNAAIDNYVNTLGQLKGLGMKLGQMLANVDALDPQRTDERKTVSASALQATPMRNTDVLELFLRELGKTPRELFSDWPQTPTFAASIGQVHRAKLRTGADVAVKLQYPEMVTTLEADLRNVKLLDRLLCVISPAQSPGTFFDELSARFMEECDYEREAESMRLFAKLFEGREDIRIPKVFDSLSTRRILTVEYVDGETFDAFAARADRSERNRAGQAIWDFFYVPARRQGAFHADPHAGNLLFADGAVTFLDFGRVARASSKFVAQWRRLARAILERDRSQALSVLGEMDFGRALDGAAGEDLYRVTLATQLPWLREGGFAFTKAYAHTVWQLFSAERLRTNLNVPREAVLWHQLLFGVFALLVPLRCTVDCREEVLKDLYGPAEQRPPPYTAAELEPFGLAFG